MNYGNLVYNEMFFEMFEAFDFSIIFEYFGCFEFFFVFLVCFVL